MMKARPIYAIAGEVRRDWKKVHFGAVPYLNAMECIAAMTDNYGADSAYSVIAYFLANARGWKGEVAKRVKKELNGMLKAKEPPRGVMVVGFGNPAAMHNAIKNAVGA